MRAGINQVTWPPNTAKNIRRRHSPVLFNATHHLHRSLQAKRQGHHHRSCEATAKPRGHTTAHHRHAPAKPRSRAGSTPDPDRDASSRPDPPMPSAAAPAKPAPDPAVAALFTAAMPKEEIGALEFLKAYPEYDGRGVVVAIFDTGVDPGASGLQETPQGEPKILDVVDCTGSGDVDTSKVVKAEEGGTIKSLHGGALRPNPEWTNPTGEWHIGAKRAFDLFPGGLKARMKKERRKRWDERQRAATTEAIAALAAFEKENKGPLNDEKRKMKEELEARVKLLSELNDKYEDAGPLLDCVVWHDGSAWRAAIDTSDMYDNDDSSTAATSASTSPRGALADFTPLTDFRAERRYATFSAEDACNFACNIYDDGNVLSIVVDAGAHGTHVAGITAAYHPEDPSLNGIAPGAQIISCKIGDSRLGSMETGVGLTRALISVLANKADVINMSYGEATATPNAGRFIQLANEVVHKHGVVFVSSAGNAGPALSTVGAPGGTSSAILAIGAYVSPALAAAGHSIREGMDEGQQYNWSSRGPTPDGHGGVVLSAPGGAIAPVPQWTQQARQLMNGTSMASPNACGGVALLLSGAKAAGLGPTPARLRRALENTALPVGGDAPDAALTYGRGLMQVHKAFEYLEKAREVDQPDVRYEVGVRHAGAAGPQQRGVYLRDAAATAPGRLSFIADVKPHLHEDADTKSERLAVEDRLVLSSTVPWVTCPGALLLPHGGRTFELQVVLQDLPEGLHYGEVHGCDAAAPWRGPLFCIPVTVIKPISVGPAASSSSKTSNDTNGNGERNAYTARLGRIRFLPGQDVRRFVAVPEGATWAEVHVRAGNHDTPKGFMLHATQLLPHTRYSDGEGRTYQAMHAHQEHVLALRVHAGATLEVTLSQFWSSAGTGELEVEVAFRGLEVERVGSGLLDGAAGTSKLLVRAPLRQENVAPSAKLKTLRIPLRPSEAVLAPLPGERDALPGARTIHSLLLTYKLKVEEAGKHRATLPMLNRYVYDGELEAQMHMVFDENKRLLGTGDIYPEPLKLKKGDHTIRLHLRHDDAGLLEKLKSLPLVVERELGEAVSVPVYASQAEAVRGGAAVKERVLLAGERTAYFLGNPPEDKLPKDAAPGRVLSGSLVLGKMGTGDKDAPATTPFNFCVPPKKESPTPAKDKDDEGEPPKSPEEQLAEAVRDAEVKFLAGMKTDSPKAAAAYEAAAARLRAAWPGHLPLLTERLKRLDDDKEARQAKLQDIVAAADDVIAAIDRDALGLFVALKTPEEGPGAARRRKLMDERKAALTEALEKKCRALLDAEKPVGGADGGVAEQREPGGGEGAAAAAPAEGGEEAPAPAAAAPAESGAPPPGPALDAFETAFLELRKWVDTAEPQYAVLHAQREARAGRLASALKALAKVADPDDKAPAREVLQLRADLFARLGWRHWHRQELSRIADAFPPAYPLF